MRKTEKEKIYRLTISALEEGAKNKSALFSAVAKRMGLSTEELANKCPSGKCAALRAELGQILEELLGRGLIKDTDGILSLTETRPVTIKALECEKKILSMLSGNALTKREIRAGLEEYFGTRRTATNKDDHLLFSHLGQILKRLVSERTLVLREDKYSVSPKKVALVGDLHSTLELKAEFLEKIHAKGGEFFEHYFLNLLVKYLSCHGKTVIEGYVTGGADDGGIDGVIKTEDCLGFKETIMVQTKNRNTHAPETEVRGFYGAVCAKMGSRGIFVTSSDFHSSASKFLSTIDNCVGINGTRIFEMAVECSYGIKNKGGKYVIDDKII